MKMKFNVMALALTVALGGMARAQELVRYNFQGTPGDHVSTMAEFEDPSVNALPFERSALLTPFVGANSINASNWTVGQYYSFGFAVAPGFQVDLTSLEIGSRSSNTGPRFFELYCSVDNFTTSLATIEHVGTAFSNTIVDLSSLSGLTGTIEFRYRVDADIRAADPPADPPLGIASGGTARVTNYFIPGPPNTDSGGVRINGVSSPVGSGATVVGAFVQHFGYTGSGSPVDTVKSLHKEGFLPQQLTFNNLINTSRGINGVVFDVQDLGNPGALSASDFQFQMSPTGAFNQAANPPSGWVAAPAPVSVTVTPGSPDRVTIEWGNNVMVNRWLRVTILSNANTGLLEQEVYYVGHLLGKTLGAQVNSYVVSFGDISPIRSAVGGVVDSGSIVDIDKTGTITFGDISAMRPSVGAELTNITVP